jgi:hypothetical protein
MFHFFGTILVAAFPRKTKNCEQVRPLQNTLFFKHFDFVFKGMFKKAKLYGLVQHTPFFFYQITPFFKVLLLKVKTRFFALFFYWATSAHL